jgi:hypothetical protein
MNNRKLLFIEAIFAVLIILTGLVYYFTIGNKPKVSFNPQKTQQYVIKEKENKQIDVMANVLPQFIVKAEAAGNNSVETRVSDIRGNKAFDVNTQVSSKEKQIMFTPKTANKFKPGMYTLNAKIKTYQGKDIIVVQDFTWGVIAINTAKSVYKTGEKVELQMAVLDEFGVTKCIARKDIVIFGTAKVWLTVISPSGKKQILSTDDGTIIGSKACADRSVTNVGDFLSEIVPEEEGRYVVHMEAETLLGKKSSDYIFNVQNKEQAFEIERRIFPTRIYPFYTYPVELVIKANRDYSGNVYDVLPKEFTISQIYDRGQNIKYDDYQIVNWDVNWEKGFTYKLTYAIKFPRVVPEFYLLGPLTIGKFNEGKEWQIASDSIFSKIQEAHNTATSGTTLTATFSTGATVNHLLILVCARDATSATISTPAGWTRAWQYTSSSSRPKISMFYRLATASQTTGTCSFSSSSGSKTAQMIEFSGNSLSGYYDGSATANSSTACDSSPYTATTNSRTPSNPDVLMVSGFTSQNGSRTFGTHTTITGADSTGFTTNYSNGFSNADMSSDSAWGEAVNNPAVAISDAVSLSGAGGRCSMGVASFNPSFTISQGSYRFFDNTNDINPGAALAPVNTTMQLAYPNYPFRIRFRLDIDSPSGTILGLQAGDFILQYGTMSAGMASCLNISQWDPVLTAVEGTDIAFNTNPDSGGSGANISTVTGDPTDTGYTSVLESYYEDNINGPNGPNPGDITNDQNQLSNNQAGLWDLSLVDNTDDSFSRHYCLRVINGDGTELDAYRNYPQVITVQTDVTIRGDTTIRGSTLIR